MLKSLAIDHQGLLDAYVHVWSFLYKQCTSSLPLFQRNTNKQTHEDDRMLKQFQATVPFFSKMVCFNIRSSSCVCLLVLRWKRGRELVHCLHKKLQTCLPTSRRPAKPYLLMCLSKKSNVRKAMKNVLNRPSGSDSEAFI